MLDLLTFVRSVIITSANLVKRAAILYIKPLGRETLE